MKSCGPYGPEVLTPVASMLTTPAKKLPGSSRGLPETKKSHGTRDLEKALLFSTGAMSLEGSGLNQVSVSVQVSMFHPCSTGHPSVQACHTGRDLREYLILPCPDQEGKLRFRRKHGCFRASSRSEKPGEQRPNQGGRVCAMGGGRASVTSGRGGGGVGGTRDSTASPGWQPSPCGEAGGSEKRLLRCSYDLSTSDIPVLRRP